MVQFINGAVYYPGAYPILSKKEKVLDDVSFTASDKAGQTIKVDKEFVTINLGDLIKNTVFSYNLFCLFIVAPILLNAF